MPTPTSKRSASKRASVTRWIASRKYLWRPPAGRSRPVEIKIGVPRRSRGDWACRLVIDGLSAPFDRDVFGIDAVQALELALVGAGKLLASSPEFRAGQIEQWGKPVKDKTALFLPLPMHSLQGVLENVRYYVERKGTRRGIEGEMLRTLLGAMREIERDLATLAAHLPIRPRRRPLLSVR